MAEFTPITTQEQFDAAIGERIRREREKFAGYMSPDDVTKKFEGYMSPADVAKKYEGYMSKEDVKAKYKGYISAEDAAAKDAKIKAYETNSVKMRIAHENGIPYEFASRLSGEDEAAIRKDAESIAKLFAGRGAPGRDPESAGKGGDGGYMRAFARSLTSKE